MRRKTDDLQADYWKTQAEQARARADLMRDLIAKTTMLEIARKYEAMAELAGRRDASGMFAIEWPPESKSDSVERFGRPGVPTLQPRAKWQPT
jgi:hypothetical protein